MPKARPSTHTSDAGTTRRAERGAIPRTRRHRPYTRRMMESRCDQCDPSQSAETSNGGQQNHEPIITESLRTWWREKMYPVMELVADYMQRTGYVPQLSTGRQVAGGRKREQRDFSWADKLRTRAYDTQGISNGERRVDDSGSPTTHLCNVGVHECQGHGLSAVAPAAHSCFPRHVPAGLWVEPIEAFRSEPEPLIEYRDTLHLCFRLSAHQPVMRVDLACGLGSSSLMYGQPCSHGGGINRLHCYRRMTAASFVNAVARGELPRAYITAHNSALWLNIVAAVVTAAGGAMFVQSPYSCSACATAEACVAGASVVFDPPPVPHAVGETVQANPIPFWEAVAGPDGFADPVCVLAMDQLDVTHGLLHSLDWEWGTDNGDKELAWSLVSGETLFRIPSFYLTHHCGLGGWQVARVAKSSLGLFSLFATLVASRYGAGNFAHIGMAGRDVWQVLRDTELAIGFARMVTLAPQVSKHGTLGVIIGERHGVGLQRMELAACLALVRLVPLVLGAFRQDSDFTALRMWTTLATMGSNVQAAVRELQELGLTAALLYADSLAEADFDKRVALFRKLGYSVPVHPSTLTLYKRNALAYKLFHSGLAVNLRGQVRSYWAALASFSSNWGKVEGLQLFDEVWDEVNTAEDDAEKSVLWWSQASLHVEPGEGDMLRVWWSVPEGTAPVVHQLHPQEVLVPSGQVAGLIAGKSHSTRARGARYMPAYVVGTAGTLGRASLQVDARGYAPGNALEGDCMWMLGVVATPGTGGWMSDTCIPDVVTHCVDCHPQRGEARSIMDERRCPTCILPTWEAEDGVHGPVALVHDMHPAYALIGIDACSRGHMAYFLSSRDIGYQRAQACAARAGVLVDPLATVRVG
ncbi:uncharacterized protein VTP21DRAFT_7205 [Calcarisporiella thermophila]|uniref:uncharacterized protein n=1 Tax=Calcarisporiella thermophila TaxID=911321 RepID=UPI00374227A7